MINKSDLIFTHEEEKLYNLMKKQRHFEMAYNYMTPKNKTKRAIKEVEIAKHLVAEEIQKLQQQIDEHMIKHQIEKRLVRLIPYVNM